MSITGETTLGELRKQFKDDLPEFYDKIRIRKDYNEVKKIINVNASAIDFFMVFVLGEISAASGSMGLKYCRLFSTSPTPAVVWRQQCGQFLYGEVKYIDTSIVTRIKEKFNNETKLKDYIKLSNIITLTDSQKDDLKKVYEYLCTDTIDGYTLGDLRKEIEDENSVFSIWANEFVKKNSNYFVDKNYENKTIRDYNNQEVNTFMLLMAIILKGAATPESIEEGGEYSGNLPRIIFYARCKKNFSWSDKKQYIWYLILMNLFGVYKQGDKSFTEQNGPNDKIKRANNDDMHLKDLLNAIDGEERAKEKLGYDVRSFFDIGELPKEEKNKRIELLKKSCKDLLNNLGLRGDKIKKDGDNKNVASIVENNIIDFNQVIFTGAPGTGKTHSVRMHVKKFGEESYKFVQFHPSYDYSDFIEGLRPVNLDSDSNENSKVPTFVRMDGVFKKFCRKIVENNLKELGFKNNDDLDIDQNKYEKLHKLFFDLKKYIDSNKNSIDNDKKEEDYINDYIEKNKDDFQELLNINDFKNNFIKLYTKKFEEIITENNNNKSDYYYFIVDEVNRADLSKVFGEIMFGLEESYRGIENRFDTQYMNLKTYEVDEKTGKAKPMKFDCFAKGFFIPRNLKFIGTMNDIDRSVESFDFALRRRFHWIDIKANEVMLESLKSMLNGKVDENDIYELSKKIISLNQVISGEIGKKLGLNEAYHIGPAYFKNYNGNNLQNIFDNNIESILKEYARGRRTDDINNLINECKNKLLNDNNVLNANINE